MDHVLASCTALYARMVRLLREAPCEASAVIAVTAVTAVTSRCIAPKHGPSDKFDENRCESSCGACAETSLERAERVYRRGGETCRRGFLQCQASNSTFGILSTKCIQEGARTVVSHSARIPLLAMQQHTFLHLRVSQLSTQSTILCGEYQR